MQTTNPETKSLSAEITVDSAPDVRGPGLWRRFSERTTPRFVKNAKKVFRENGFKGVIRTYGWKAVAAVFVYYLVRDSILYLLIPYLVAKGLF